LNATIDEGLQIEAEQFARMAATQEIHKELNAWIARRRPAY
jgi:hypothetical protein